MKNKSKLNTEDLQECLAGFMLVAATNGAVLGEDHLTWAQGKLKGKTRTPAQVWREMFGKSSSSSMPTLLQDIQDRLSAAETILAAVNIDTKYTCYSKQDLWRLLNECHALLAQAIELQTKL